jgi:signal peptidase I
MATDLTPPNQPNDGNPPATRPDPRQGALIEKQGGHSVFVRWMRDIAISLAVSAFFIIFLYQPVRVDGTSMLPTLEDQERVFVNKFVYRFERIERGDVIVFRYPLEPSKSYIKRIIAGPGDRIRIENGLVFVNGHQIDEPYVPAMYEDVRSYGETVVGPHSYFVMGDHRNLSRDSRDFGPVDESYIYGKAVFGYWPMARLGKLQ